MKGVVCVAVVATIGNFLQGWDDAIIASISQTRISISDMYIEQVYLGIITLAPTKDVLTLALGKDDHYGRVRVVGFGVTKKSYFGAPKPKDSASKQEVLALKNEIAKLKQQMVRD